MPSLHAHLGQADSVFSGIATFGRLPYTPCLANPDETYDVAFIGTALVWLANMEFCSSFVWRRCPVRYRHLLPTRSSFRPEWNPARFSSSQSLVSENRIGSCLLHARLTQAGH